MRALALALALLFVAMPAMAQRRDNVGRKIHKQNFNLSTGKLKNDKQTCLATEPAVSKSGECSRYCNSVSNLWFVSCNGGAYGEVGSGAGATTGGTVTQFDEDAVADESFARQRGTTGKLLEKAQMTENDAGDVVVAGNFATVENSCESNADCNFLQLFCNEGAATVSCATQGVVGTATFLDTDNTSVCDIRLCQGTTEVANLSASGAVPGTDSVGPDELDDGSSTPTVSFFVKVDNADDSKFEYLALATGEITTTEILDLTVSSDDLAVVNTKHTECIYIENPAAESFDTIWRAPVDVTITEIFCETDANTVEAMLERDDGSAADIQAAVLVCPVSPGLATSSFSGSENVIADGNKIDLDFTSPGSVANVTVCFEYTIDE